MKTENLKSRIGQKAQIKIIKSKRSSYWYKNKIGKKLFATLVKVTVFTDIKTLQWRVPDNTSVSGCAWINIKDAEIIQWCENEKKPSDKFNPTAVGFKRVKKGYNNVIYARYEIVEGKKRIVDWISHADFDFPKTWMAYKTTYYGNDTQTTDRIVFQGKIPTNSFAKQLFKNIF